MRRSRESETSERAETRSDGPSLAAVRDELRADRLERAAARLAHALWKLDPVAGPGPRTRELGRLLRTLSRLVSARRFRDRVADPVGSQPLDLRPLARALSLSWHSVLRGQPDAVVLSGVARRSRIESPWGRCLKAIVDLGEVAGEWELVIRVTGFARTCRRHDGDLAAAELRALCEAGRAREAAELGLRLTAVHPDHAGTRVAFARALEQVGHSLRAAATLYAASKRTQSFEILMALAELQHRRGLLESARGAYHAAILSCEAARRPDRWQAHLRLADVYLAQRLPVAAAFQVLQARDARAAQGWTDDRPVLAFVQAHAAELQPATVTDPSSDRTGSAPR